MAGPAASATSVGAGSPRERGVGQTSHCFTQKSAYLPYIPENTSCLLGLGREGGGVVDLDYEREK
jgi:hypothetical protein